MKLSNQALGALMMALQKSLMEQSDITETLMNFDFQDTNDGLVIENPPVVKFNHEDAAVLDMARNPGEYEDLEV
tara:strand:- start:7876 stop:8097 length:222 start_codon:yes stop_codon:yes gene_type:complete